MTPNQTARTLVDAPEQEADDLMALTKRAGTGDLVATQQVLSEVLPTIRRVAAGVLGYQHMELDDAVQQTLIAVARALPAFRGECHPAGYASRIALHVALRIRRYAAVRRTRTETLAQHGRGQTEAVPCEELGDERRKRAMRDLLADLPTEQAEALGLRILLGWSLDEVSQASGAPVNTIRSRVRLAKEALRRRLESEPRLASDLEFRP